MSKTILLADDSVTIQKVIELTFMDQDYDLDAVSNGDDALERLGQSCPDFVIADVHMPGASGYEVARRSKERYPGVPVLLLVGTFEPFDEAEFRSSGADETLKKPFDSQELLRIVAELSPSAPSESEASESEVKEPAPSESVLGGELSAESSLPADSWTTAPFSLGTEAPREEEPFKAEVSEPPAEVLPEPISDIWAAEPEEVAAVESTEIPPVEVVAEPIGLEETPQAPIEAEAIDLPEFAPTAVEPPSVEPAAAELAQEAIVAAEAEAEVIPPASATPELESPEAASPISEDSAQGSMAAEVAQPVPLSGSLSDDDVERIARRVVEKLSEKMTREIAWEVIPDLAEVVIKDRLRELESQVE